MLLHRETETLVLGSVKNIVNQWGEIHYFSFAINYSFIFCFPNADWNTRKLMQNGCDTHPKKQDKLPKLQRDHPL